MQPSCAARDQNEVVTLAEELYRTHHRYLRRIAAHHLVNGEEVPDAVQEVFASFLRAFHRAEAGTPPVAWLTLSLQRECWARNRRLRFSASAGQERASESTGRGFSVTAVPAGPSEPERVVERTEEARSEARSSRMYG